ncbi:hypothetical protein LTR37_001890 [Vermiconidia calcicola]|uniref:Uncharacterized protein n=1 Tax=Vermiconidia calcicola TaxID=1690605 RepID=A0ACC3NU09_9PEZI|nr:hypothetical protein LTR37_001890 [Vermiconidia calcicola]
MAHITVTRFATTHGGTAGWPLLSLALEIRVMIYELVVDCTKEGGKLAIGTVSIPLLAQTCRQLRQEVLPVLAASIKHNVWVVVLPAYDNVNLQRSRRESLPREQRRITAISSILASGGCATASAMSFEINPVESSRRDSLDASVSQGVAWNVDSQKLKPFVDRFARAGSSTTLEKETNWWIAFYKDSAIVKEAKSKIEELVAEDGFDGFKLQDVTDIISVYLAALLRARRRDGFV